MMPNAWRKNAQRSGEDRTCDRLRRSVEFDPKLKWPPGKPTYSSARLESLRLQTRRRVRPDQVLDQRLCGIGRFRPGADTGGEECCARKFARQWTDELRAVDRDDFRALRHPKLGFTFGDD